MIHFYVYCCVRCTILSYMYMIWIIKILDLIWVNEVCPCAFLHCLQWWFHGPWPICPQVHHNGAMVATHSCGYMGKAAVMDTPLHTDTKWPLFCRQHFQIHFIEWQLLYFDWNFTGNMFLGVQLAMCNHGFRKWLGTENLTSHNLNKWWSCLLTHICVSGPRWVKTLKGHRFCVIVLDILNYIIWLTKFCKKSLTPEELGTKHVWFYSQHYNVA